MSVSEQLLVVFVERLSGPAQRFPVPIFVSSVVPADVHGLRIAINGAFESRSKRLCSRAPLYEASFDPTTGVAGEWKPVTGAIDPAKAYCFREADLRESCAQLPDKRVRLESDPDSHPPDPTELFAAVAGCVQEGAFIMPVAVAAVLEFPKFILRRKCIDDLYDELLVNEETRIGGTFGAPETQDCNRLGRAALIGTPGIGKTVALFHILWRYLTDPAGPKPWRFVLLVLPNAGTHVLFDTAAKTATTYVYTERINVYSLHSEAKVSNTLILHDLGESRPATARAWYTILASSPDTRKYNEFMKGSDDSSKWRYVPLFTDDEMTALAAVVNAPGCSEKSPITLEGKRCTSWHHVAYFFDNVPRDVFRQRPIGVLANLTKALVSAVKGCEVDKAARDAPPHDQLLRYCPRDYNPNDLSAMYDVSFRRGYVSDNLRLAMCSVR